MSDSLAPPPPTPHPAPHDDAARVPSEAIASPSDPFVVTASSSVFLRHLREKRIPLRFDLELTARCNNDCRHCYINLPAGDRQARAQELGREEIRGIAEQAIDLGAIRCLISGGEPMLRDDFAGIYLDLRRLGLQLTVFTNACLVTDDVVAVLREFPPYLIEVSVYGAAKETYERVTRRPGSYEAFRRGLDLLLQAGIRVVPKSVAIRSNLEGVDAITKFCRAISGDSFRFDPLMVLRRDGDPRRNEEIRKERLSPEEIVQVEDADPERSAQLDSQCERLHEAALLKFSDERIFYCEAGTSSFHVGYDGTFRLCHALSHPDFTYNLRQGTLAEAWNKTAALALQQKVEDQEFRALCRPCSLINLCLWCPAHAYLETGRMDAHCHYFCQVAHLRSVAILKRVRPSVVSP